MKSSATKQLVLAALFGALTYISGLFRIPIGPVPFTLQTAAVILCGLYLPVSSAFFSQLVNLFLLFLLGGGAALFVSPSFGFVIGFIIAAPVMSWLAHHRLTMYGLFSAAVCGEVLFYLVGIPYMSYILLSVKGMELSVLGILQIGLIPFVIPDLAKLALAVIAASRLRKWKK